MNGISFWEASFLWRDPLIAVCLGAFLCSLAGVFVVLKRSAFVGAAVSQAAGLGVVLALLAPHVIGLSPPPLAAGILVGASSAGLFSLSRKGGRVGVESSIALAYVIAGAASLLLGVFLTHEYEAVHSLLFGDAVAAPPEELLALAVTAVGIALIQLAFGRKLLFVSFDPETARAMGMAVRRYNATLYFSIGLGLAVATRALGALPVFALTVIPAAGGLLLFDRLRAVFAFAIGTALASGVVGYYLSFVWEKPTGAMIVACAAIALVPGSVRSLLRR
ncbi:metal ABC transporter permease [Vulgatibacter incomptus]|uniref:Zinc ABC transporter, inner membrane permease protein ZnuB n=1 Tax=Vulgatibacter incomptus TaxID=1391653 RepID=A0A0K1PD67_9BACT|nr:metal ABC transporter permease [Vulgatibacter incomptus]AKU91488.1 Zinc ABC transporter, inner membrane permease protein ZnuB [Vulgatibacter incomptus]